MNVEELKDDIFALQEELKKKYDLLEKMTEDKKSMSAEIVATVRVRGIYTRLTDKDATVEETFTPEFIMEEILSHMGFLYDIDSVTIDEHIRDWVSG